MEKNLFSLHDKLANIHWWFKGRQKIILNLIKKFVPPKNDLKILDAGCGTGEFLSLLSTYGNAVGIDNAKEVIEICKKKGYEVHQSSILSLPFPTNNFDLSLALDVIEHLEDDFKAIQELKRVTKPDGLIFITVPAYQFLWSGHDDDCFHKRRYTANYLKELGKRVNLKLIKLSYFNTLLALPIILIRLFKKLLKIKTLDLERVNPFLNTILKWIFSCEFLFLKYFNLPFGISILVIFKKNVS